MPEAAPEPDLGICLPRVNLIDVGSGIRLYVHAIPAASHSSRLSFYLSGPLFFTLSHVDVYIRRRRLRLSPASFLTSSRLHPPLLRITIKKYICYRFSLNFLNND